MNDATPRTYLYGYGMLSHANPTGSTAYQNVQFDGPNLGSGDYINRLESAGIRDAGFTDLILWTLHVWPNGDVYYGDGLAASCGKVVADFRRFQMDARVADLKQGGGLRVVFGIGTGGPDFQNIANLSPEDYQTFLSNLKALKDLVGTDGFDFDVEGDDVNVPVDKFVQLVADIVGMGQMVSFSPTTDPGQNAWVIPTLQALHASTGGQPVSWINVQTYGGVDDSIVSGWTDLLDASTGVGDPLAFVGFALGVSWGGYKPPSAFQAAFGGLSKDAKPGGGGLWNLSDVYNGVYGNAPYAASHGQPQQANQPANNPDEKPLGELELVTPGAYAEAIRAGLQSAG